MIINERGLARELKRAYKRGGYILMHNDAQITVFTEDWYVSAEREKFPVKALATIVEHLGGLPTSADALRIYAGTDPQIVMPEAVAAEVNAWMSGTERGSVSMVPMIVRGLQVFQREGGGNCYGVNLDHIGIVEQLAAMESTAAEIDEHRLMWEDEGELILVSAERPTAAYWEKKSEKEVWSALESVDLHKRDE